MNDISKKDRHVVENVIRILNITFFKRKLKYIKNMRKIKEQIY